MYLRTTQRRNKDGSVVRYLALAENVRHPEKGYVEAKVVHSFGRADQLDRAALERLVASIQRVLAGRGWWARRPRGRRGGRHRDRGKSRRGGRPGPAWRRSLIGLARHHALARGGRQRARSGVPGHGQRFQLGLQRLEVLPPGLP